MAHERDFADETDDPCDHIPIERLLLWYTSNEPHPEYPKQIETRDTEGDAL